jgi:hypothetical protein
MALNTTTLSTALRAAFMANLTSPTAGQTTQVNNMCDSIAAAILAFVEGATITYTAGLTAPPGGGPVTGVFGCVIS